MLYQLKLKKVRTINKHIITTESMILRKFIVSDLKELFLILKEKVNKFLACYLIKISE